VSDQLQTRETMLLHLENENKAADLNFPRIGINTAELRSEVERLLEEAAQARKRWAP